jgi:hypothetical protein
MMEWQWRSGLSLRVLPNIRIVVSGGTVAAVTWVTGP